MRSRRWLSFFFPILIFFLSFNPSASIFVDTEKLYTPAKTLSGETVDTLSSSPHDFLWPTDASHTVTSTFGEYRHTHFHSGIDISTKIPRDIKCSRHRGATFGA